MGVPEGAVGKAHRPRDLCQMPQGADAGIMPAVDERVRSVLVDIVQRDALFGMAQGGRQMPANRAGRPHSVMSLQKKSFVGQLLAEPDHLVGQALRLFEAAIHVVISPQPPEHGEKLLRLTDALTKLPRAQVDLTDLGASRALEVRQRGAQRQA